MLITIKNGLNFFMAVYIYALFICLFTCLLAYDLPWITTS